jgi:hypothetical protein
MSYSGSLTYNTTGEYSGLNPNGTVGSYTNLANYNASYPYGGGAMAPVPATQTLANSRILIPAYGSMGYNSLTHGTGANYNGVYFTRSQAYPGMNAQGQCTATQYIARGC